jgi:hypothetical protein
MEIKFDLLTDDPLFSEKVTLLNDNSAFVFSGTFATTAIVEPIYS